MFKAILIIVFASLVGLAQGQLDQVFLAAFLDMKSQCGTAELRINSRIDGTIQVTNRHDQSDDSHSVTSGETRSITLASDICTTVNIENKGIRIQAPAGVTVHGVIRTNNRFGGFLAVPVDENSLDFIVATFDTRESDNSIITVIASEHDTQVTFGLCKDSVCTDNDFSETLDSLQTFTYKGLGTDLTGTRIQSDKPIAVMAGNDQTQIPISRSVKDHTVEQFPPLHSWGSEYAPLTVDDTLERDIFRIVAGLEETDVRIILRESNNSSPSTQSPTVVETVLAPRHFTELEEDDDPVSISCSKPCLVTQYNKGGNSNLGYESGPSMSVLWPTKAWTDSCIAKFDGYPGGSFSHYIRLVAANEDMSSIKFNGQPVDGWAEVPETDYSTAIIDAGQGQHKVESQAFQNFAAYILEKNMYTSYLSACNADLYQQEDGFRRPPTITSEENSVTPQEVVVHCDTVYPYDIIGVSVRVQWLQDGVVVLTKDLPDQETRHTLQESELTGMFGKEITCNGQLVTGDGTVLEERESQPFNLGLQVLNPVVNLEMPEAIRSFPVKLLLNMPFLCSAEDIVGKSCFFDVELWHPTDQGAPNCWVTVNNTNKDNVIEMPVIVHRPESSGSPSSMWVSLRTAPHVLPHPIWGGHNLTDIQVTPNVSGYAEMMEKEVTQEQKTYCTCSSDHHVECDFNK